MTNNDTELPPLDTPADEWDDYWDEPTTITVDRWVKAQLDHQRDNQPWNDYLESLRRMKADPLTFNEVQGIAEFLRDELDLTSTDELLEQLGVIEERVNSIDRTIDELTQT